MDYLHGTNIREMAYDIRYTLPDGSTGIASRVNPEMAFQCLLRLKRKGAELVVELDGEVVGRVWKESGKVNYYFRGKKEETSFS